MVSNLVRSRNSAATTLSTIYTCPASGVLDSKILSFRVCNKTSTVADLSLVIGSGGSETYIYMNYSLGAYKAIAMYTSTYFLLPGEFFKLRASAVDSLDYDLLVSERTA